MRVLFIALLFVLSSKGFSQSLSDQALIAIENLYEAKYNLSQVEDSLKQVYSFDTLYAQRLEHIQEEWNADLNKTINNTHAKPKTEQETLEYLILLYNLSTRLVIERINELREGKIE